MVPSIVFSPDGKTLASTDSKGTLKLWDIATEKERVSIHNDDCTFFLQPLAFTADGERLISIMQRNTGERDALIAKVWEASSGKEQAAYMLPPDKDGFFTAFTALSADGKTLAIGGFERLDKGKRPQSEWKINGVTTVSEVKSLQVLTPKRPAGAESGDKRR
jgi:WD40 repeat protein